MVTLVTPGDDFLGTMDKMAAHRTGALHRAFSVFIFNSEGQILLQKRATHKYHSGGLWTNSCCSHPLPGEPLVDAARRRLQEELNLEADLFPLFSFHYTASFSNGLTENELDHILLGLTDEFPVLCPDEAEEYTYMHPEQIRQALQEEPESFTVWFRLLFEEYGERIVKSFQAVV